MKHKTILNFVSLVWGLICLACMFVPDAFSQNTEQEKPTIKDFGKSLNKGKEPDGSQNREILNEKTDDGDLIKVETNLVRTDVLVIDQSGKAVLGLKANDFIVTENNVPQEIGTFSLGDNVEVPRSIVLIIDYSGSQLPYIKTSVDAAKVLVDKLNPKDKMAIVTDDVALLSPFTKDKKLLKKSLDSLVNKVRERKVGKSLQYSALMATLNELFDAEDLRPIVIFQTDGDEYFDIKPSNPQPNYLHSKNETNFTDKEFIETVEKSHATIYSVISGDSFVGLSPEERFKKTEKLLIKRNLAYYKYSSTKVWNEFVKNYVQKYSEAFF